MGTWQAQQQQQAILQHVSDEIEFLEGIEAVYVALLHRQTITSLMNQASSLHL